MTIWFKCPDNKHFRAWRHSALALLLFISVFMGCTARTQEGGSYENSSQPAQSSIASSEETADPSADELFPETRYPCSPWGWRWSDDGQLLAISNGNLLQFIDLNNRLVNSVEIPPIHPGIACGWYWNDNMLFVVSGGELLSEKTRVVFADGRYTFSNAAIYTTEGMLVRAFPQASQDDLEKSVETYERAFPFGVDGITWIDDDHFALRASGRLFIYSVSEDRMALIDDVTGEKRLGYTVYDSPAYDFFDGWVDGGIYYYSVCRSRDDKGIQQIELYSADMETGKHRVLEDGAYYDRYQSKNGLLFAYRSFSDLTNYDPVTGNGNEFGFDAWYAPLAEPVLKPLTRLNTEGVLPVSDGRLISYATFDHAASTCTLHCLDTLTGSEIAFVLQELEERPLAYGMRSYGLLGTRLRDSNVQFIYFTGDEEERKNPQTGETQIYSWLNIYLYDTAAKDRRPVAVAQTLNNETALNSSMTHLVEGYDSVRIVEIGG